MAERKPLFLDADGFPTEMSPGSDSVRFQSITVMGTAGITLVSGTVTGVPTPQNPSDVANKAYFDAGLPSAFLINGVAVSANVTAANLTALTGGGSTSLHTHASATSVPRVENTYTVGSNVTAGQPVYFSANNSVAPALANTTTGNKVIGIAKTTITVGNPVVVLSEGILTGILSGATAGDYVYLAASGGLTTVKPSSSGNRIVRIGYAVNATDLFVLIDFFGVVA